MSYLTIRQPEAYPRIVFNPFKSNKWTQIVFIIFAVLLVWWLTIYLRGIKTNDENYFFGAAYAVISLIGGILGLGAARKWGGWSAVIGRAITVLSIGLLFQTIGQYVFWYYNFVLHVEVPYPSVADVGFFGSVLVYIYGIYLLAKASGIRFSSRSKSGLVLAIVVPVIMLSASYFLFLNSYSFDTSNLLESVLNYGYPLGQAVYISLAILTLSLSRNFLGGIMKNKIMWLVVAFVAQYLADYIFLYFQDSYYNASPIDLMYLIAYFLMTVGLIQIGVAADSIKKDSGVV